MKRPSKLNILKWAARISSILLFLIWSGFFMEHLSWFRNPGDLPPATVFFGMFAHMSFLLGLLIAFRHEITGSILIIAGAIILFSRVGSPVAFLVMTGTALIPAALYIFHWWHTDREGSIFYRLISGKGDPVDQRLVFITAARWLLRLTAAFVAVLAVARYFGGESFLVWFDGSSWSMKMSEGFPRPLSMGLRELAAFVLAGLAVISAATAWIRECCGGTALCIFSGLYVIVSTGSAYPLVPSGVIAGALILLLGLYEHRINTAASAMTENAL